MISRIMVAGGGTGGHLFPGLAVVEEIRRRRPEIEIVFVGTERGIESRVLPSRGEKLELIEALPLKGGRALRGVMGLPRGLGQSVRLLRRHRPDFVLGLGGYAAGPVVAAASAMRIPTALLEQNAVPGLTNRLLRGLVDRAYVTFEATARWFGGKARVVGNPVRRSLVAVARQAASDPVGFEARCKNVLVLGGSQGAEALNQTVPEALARCHGQHPGFNIVHQAGRGMKAVVEDRYAKLGIAAEAVEFIDDMARAYAQASVVVGRAGASTVAELCAVGRPSVLVPYPFAADDHQSENARVLEESGAAICIPQAELTAAHLADKLAALLHDQSARHAMALAARALGRPDAAAAVVDDLCEWLDCDHWGWSHEARGADASAVEGHLYDSSLELQLQGVWHRTTSRHRMGARAPRRPLVVQLTAAE